MKKELENAGSEIYIVILKSNKFKEHKELDYLNETK